jgi:hypothetical protein
MAMATAALLIKPVFRGYEEIVEQVSRAWNTFIADVERVKSLCWREWTNLVN